jgi:hypothetical protein
MIKRWVCTECDYVAPAEENHGIGDRGECWHGHPAVVVSETSPKAIAAAEGRDYITPEDITLSVNAGHPSLDLCLVVLDALESGAAEDPSLCAFVATKYVRARP